MKVLIVEDDEDKRNEISDYVLSLGVPDGHVETAVDMAEFASKFDRDTSICVIDLKIPAYEGAGPDLNGLGVLQTIERAGAANVKLLAISSYPEEFVDVRAQFERRGCMLVDHNERTVWHNVLKQMVIEAQATEQMDFLIFCALRSERAPYTGMADLRGKPIFKDNLSRLDLTIGGRRGAVIELPRMGLVDAAVASGQCIEKFRPKIVAMSGICAGFAGRAQLGQLLVSELAYEYQSGKWTADGFSQEPYQAPIPEDVRVRIRELIEDQQLLSRLESGWTSDRPSKMTSPMLAAFTSGSAVIASETLMSQVSTYHRRVAGLDMEVYAVMRAAQIAHCQPSFFCAKVVVDLAGGDKDDRIQPYGCAISANFTVEVLRNFFSQA